MGVGLTSCEIFALSKLLPGLMISVTYEKNIACGKLSVYTGIPRLLYLKLSSIPADKGKAGCSGRHEVNLA